MPFEYPMFSPPGPDSPYAAPGYAPFMGTPGYGPYTPSFTPPSYLQQSPLSNLGFSTPNVPGMGANMSSMAMFMVMSMLSGGDPTAMFKMGPLSGVGNSMSIENRMMLPGYMTMAYGPQVNKLDSKVLEAPLLGQALQALGPAPAATNIAATKAYNAAVAAAKIHANKEAMMLSNMSGSMPGQMLLSSLGSALGVNLNAMLNPASAMATGIFNAGLGMYRGGGRMGLSQRNEAAIQAGMMHYFMPHGLMDESRAQGFDAADLGETMQVAAAYGILPSWVKGARGPDGQRIGSAASQAAHSKGQVSAITGRIGDINKALRAVADLDGNGKASIQELFKLMQEVSGGGVGQMSMASIQGLATRVQETMRVAGISLNAMMKIINGGAMLAKEMGASTLIAPQIGITSVLAEQAGVSYEAQSHPGLAGHYFGRPTPQQLIQTSQYAKTSYAGSPVGGAFGAYYEMMRARFGKNTHAELVKQSHSSNKYVRIFARQELGYSLSAADQAELRNPAQFITNSASSLGVALYGDAASGGVVLSGLYDPTLEKEGGALNARNLSLGAMSNQYAEMTEEINPLQLAASNILSMQKRKGSLLANLSDKKAVAISHIIADTVASPGSLTASSMLLKLHTKLKAAGINLSKGQMTEVGGAAVSAWGEFDTGISTLSGLPYNAFRMNVLTAHRARMRNMLVDANASLSEGMQNAGVFLMPFTDRLFDALADKNPESAMEYVKKLGNLKGGAIYHGIMDKLTLATKQFETAKSQHDKEEAALKIATDMHALQQLSGTDLNFVRAISKQNAKYAKLHGHLLDAAQRQSYVADSLGIYNPKVWESPYDQVDMLHLKGKQYTVAAQAANAKDQALAAALHQDYNTKTHELNFSTKIGDHTYTYHGKLKTAAEQTQFVHLQTQLATYNVRAAHDLKHNDMKAERKDQADRYDVIHKMQALMARAGGITPVTATAQGVYGTQINAMQGGVSTIARVIGEIYTLLNNNVKHPTPATKPNLPSVHGKPVATPHPATTKSTGNRNQRWDEGGMFARPND